MKNKQAAQSFEPFCLGEVDGISLTEKRKS